MRRTVLRAAAAAAACALTGVRFAHAQNTPPITLILGFPAGAGVDSLTRTLAEKMGTALGRTVIVENRVGAAGRLAAQYAKRLPPDGNTVLIAPMSNMAIFPHTYKALGYDPFKDFDPVAHLAEFGLALAVRADTPARTLKDYVALVKKDRDMGLWASTGMGSPAHFFGVMFERAAGIELTHIPHRGSADVVNALLGGHIKAAILTVNDVATHHRSGKMRALASSAAKREPTMTDVPTFKEQGFDIEGSFWYGAYVPAKTSPEVIARLGNALVAAAQSPDLREWGAKVGLNLTGGNAQVLAQAQKTDYDRWGPVIKATGFVAQD